MLFSFNIQHSTLNIQHSAFFRLSNQKHTPIPPIQLHHHRLAQRRVRDAVTEHDPAIGCAAALSARGPGDMDGFVAAESHGIFLLKNRYRPRTSVIAQDAARTARWIGAMLEGHEKNPAQHNPRGVEEPVAPKHARYHSGPMTRAEIEEKLAGIVRKEKNVADDKLTLETPLADAGIDSLDALTILFAIEEEFHISIPDDRARAIRTFGDMVDSIEALI
jgi:acyl carrier protein